VQNDEADVEVGLPTDGQLTSSGLTALKNKKSIWSFYYPASVMRNDVLKATLGIEDILDPVTATSIPMRGLNGRVDLQQDPEKVARDFLQKQRLAKL
jgi:glycine betaine/choline ABC-type transport system substrate-binding protein